MGEERGRKALVACLFVVALLGLTSFATIVVMHARESDAGSSALRAKGTLAPAGAGEAVGRSRLPGAEEPTTFEAGPLADTAPLDEEGAENATGPERYHDQTPRAPQPPPEGATPDPNEEKTSPASGGGLPQAEPAPTTSSSGIAGAYEPTVVAVLDSCFDPYHYDFLGSKMPQHTDSDLSNDLPLTTNPRDWVPGFPAPGPDTYASFAALDLTLPTLPSSVPTSLHAGDASDWAAAASPLSAPGSVHLFWIPGTKVIGYANFGDSSCPDGFSPNSHGVGTTSVSVGNLHGSCPECLFVFVNGLSENANRWLEKQTWIDVQTNSWGASTTGVVRDRYYAGSDVNAQKDAIERGQGIFFSAGNGVNNDFSIPNPTLVSSQEGPDWIITVGAVTQTGEVIAGAGKPADIASVGDSYPSAGAATVSSDAVFGGTSNATPVTAGIYARALHQLRMDMAGASRLQTGGKISVGSLPCGSANPACATADGIVTIDELRQALFYSPTLPNAWRGYTPRDPVVGAQASFGIGGTASQEMYLAGAGHGYFLGRIGGLANLDAETKTIVDFAEGEWLSPQDADVYEWMLNDSWCRQQIWGTWTHGYWDPGSAPPAFNPTKPGMTALYGDCTWETAAVEMW